MLKPLIVTRPQADELGRRLHLPGERSGAGPFAIDNREATEPIVRLGKIYGGVAAAVYDGSGTLVQAKKCEVLLHRIRADGSQMEDFETEPETAYSIVTSDLADGAEVVCLRDRTINDPDHPEVAQPGWVVLAAAGGGGSFIERPCELCMSAPQTVTVDTKTYLRFATVKNLNTEWYRPGDLTGVPVTDADTLSLLKIGWYEIGYSIMWEGPITSAGGTGNSDDIEWSEGDIYLEVAGTTIIPCSAAKHYVLHHNATGGSMGGTATRQVLFRTSPGNGQINLAVANGSATHNRTFSGVMWANYLGHDLDPDTTIADIS